MTDWWTVLVIACLALVTLVTRCFFFLLDRPWALPSWADRALHYAPVAALAGVILPEILTTNGKLITTALDARVFGAAAGMAVYFWRRNVLLTMLAGMAVYLPLRLGLGW
jgi:branched-subunit amino acid transport protein